MTDFESPILIIDGQIIEPEGIIAAETAQQCDLCGEIDELRPYGPNDEAVCFDCGMKDEDAAKRAFNRRMEGGSS